MKKKLLLLFFCSQFYFGFSQKIEGNWHGDLAVSGQTIELILHLTKNGTNYESNWDVPIQGAKGMPSSTTIVNGNNLEIDIKGIQAGFSGVASVDYSKIEGNWKQGGLNFPLVLKPLNPEDAPKEITKTQTPKPPYSYESEDITYVGSKTGLTYGATYSYPKNTKNFPVLILITGSGQQDRDETLMGHKPFAVIADAFTKNGYGVLRIDDRGIGKSTGNFKESTSEDFANDVEEHLAYIKTKPNINLKKIGLLGHSEGGIIAPMVAARNKDISFLILLAAPGIPISELMTNQNKDVLKSTGIDDEVISTYLPLYKKLLTEITSSKDIETAKKTALIEVQKWRKTSSKEQVKATTNITDSNSEKAYVATMVNTLSTPWWKFFANYKPQTNLEKIRCPVLVLNGGSDIQVSAQPNINGIRTALQKANNSLVTVNVFPKMNHLFQRCSLCSVAEYGQLATTIEPEVLQYMVEWLKNTL